jgi:indolepyruvate decarboxylase
MDSEFRNYIDNYGLAYASTLPCLGQAMSEVLQFFNIDTIYGVGGDFAANLISAFESDIELAPSSNEMHAGFTACADAEIRGIGAVLTTYTVGSLPCTSSAALAKAEKLPVVFISGCPGEAEIKQAALHHTVISASTWTPDYDCALNAFSALGIKSIRLQGSRNKHQANIAAEKFFQAIREAYLNKEPVYIEVPRDLVKQKTQSLSLPKSSNNLQGDNFVLDGSQAIVANIQARLRESTYPVLFIGENIKLNLDLIELVVKFCHQFNIPYVTSWLAKGIFAEDDPLCLGAYNGVFSQPELQKYFDHCVDYILEIDSSIYQTDISSAFGTGTHRVLDFDNKTVLKGSVQSSRGLVKAFTQLNQCDIPRFSFKPQNSATEIIDENQQLSFKTIAPALNQIQNKTEQAFVYLPEVGTSFFAAFGLKTKKSQLNRSWLSNPWYGAMGTSLPYARAVSKIIKKKQLTDIPMIITGDGGFHFQLNELIHFQRESLNLIIIYMRNDIFQLGKSSDSSMYQCSTSHFDVLKLIEAYGGTASHCDSMGDLESAIGRGIEQRGLHLIEVFASTDVNEQCKETDLLNLFIKSNNGDPAAQKQWQEICSR